MNFTSAGKLINDVWGKVGTPERDAIEAQLKEEMQAYFVGEAIKAERLKQHLTQEELGAKVGMKKSQISKLESGKCIITLPTMSRIFKALGFGTASLDLGRGGKIALWQYHPCFSGNFIIASCCSGVFSLPLLYFVFPFVLL